LGPDVNLMLTSRPNIGIGHVISNYQVQTIRATEDDMRAYLHTRILESSRLSKHISNSRDLRKTIEERIVQRSNGMLVSRPVENSH
jgi:hypothetical protein